MAARANLIPIKQARSDAILFPLYTYVSHFKDCFKRNTQEFSGRLRSPMSGFFFFSERLLCPNSGVWAPPSWFPFRDSGWIWPVIRSRGNKLLSGLCLSSRPVYFMLLWLCHSFPCVCVILPTISNSFEGHYRGPLRRGEGWGRPAGCLARWLVENMRTTPSPRSTASTSATAAQSS